MYTQAIIQALERLGSVSALDSDEFMDAHYSELNGVQWQPTYLFQCAATIWGVTIFSGDRIPEREIGEMAKASARLANLQPAYFVPENRNADFILEICSANGVAVIGKMGETYRLQETSIDFAVKAHFDRRLYIPSTVTERCQLLKRLERPFLDEILAFAQEHQALAHKKGNLLEDEERLVKQACSRLLEADERFSLTTKPIDLLRQIELICQEDDFRDHYFHTLHNFLLGCLVIEETRDHFARFLGSYFPDRPGASVEYAWLLTALFHDVGYLMQRKVELDAEITGIRGDFDNLSGVPTGCIPEHFALQLASCWQSPQYQDACNQLVHLFVHLSSEAGKPWIRDPRFDESHPFRSALRDCYMLARHGAASSFRLLLAVFPQHPRLADKQVKEFLAVHAFLAGVSIPLHDAHFRDALRKAGILKIRTSQFPFGALLAFIDSIQDDRREPLTADSSKDILEGLQVENGTVRASLDMSKMGRTQIITKTREARDILDFLDCDGLTYEYPKGLLA